MIVAACIEGGVAGLIVSNTTTSRPPGSDRPLARDAGGLLWRAAVFRCPPPAAPVPAAGAGRLVPDRRRRDCFPGGTRLRKSGPERALVQLYTGFAYAGPALIPRLKPNC